MTFDAYSSTTLYFDRGPYASRSLPPYLVLDLCDLRLHNATSLDRFLQECCVLVEFNKQVLNILYSSS